MTDRIVTKPRRLRAVLVRMYQAMVQGAANGAPPRCSHLRRDMGLSPLHPDPRELIFRDW